MLPTEANFSPVPIYRMNYEQLSCLGKVVTHRTIELKHLNLNLHAEANELLSRSLHLNNFRYADLTNRTLISTNLEEESSFRGGVIEAIMRQLSFLEQNRYLQRTHCSSSMFWQGAE